MNYTKIYKQLIDKRKECTFKGYGENHHITPVSFGGTLDKENMVRLTAREHFIAHRLLTKIYPNSYEMKSAINKMLQSNKFQKRYEPNSKTYERIREEFGEAHSKRMKGKKLTAEHKKAVSEGQRKFISNLSEEEKLIRIEKSIGLGSRKNVAVLKNTRDKMSNSQKEYHKNMTKEQKIVWDEARRKSGIKLKGRIVSDETKKKLSEAAKKDWVRRKLNKEK